MKINKNIPLSLLNYVNRIVHFWYFDPDYPKSGLTVTGLSRVHCITKREGGLTGFRGDNSSNCALPGCDTVESCGCCFHLQCSPCLLAQTRLHLLSPSQRSEQLPCSLSTQHPIPRLKHFNLKTEAGTFPVTSASTYKATRCHNPEDYIVNEWSEAHFSSHVIIRYLNRSIKIKLLNDLRMRSVLVRIVESCARATLPSKDNAVNNVIIFILWV
jgi:hypothetical protein